MTDEKDSFSPGRATDLSDVASPEHSEPAPAHRPAHAATYAGAHAAPAAAAAPASQAPMESAPEAVPPGDTAEIDVAAVERKLNDPGNTQSFEPVADEPINTDSTYDAGTTTTLMWGARSDVGCVRSHNEDSYLVQSPLFCVCDGMGGHAAGEVASSIAVETISKTAPQAADPALLAAAVEAANAAVIEAANNGVGRPGMGCTATAAYLEGQTLAIAHVGDSRAYLLHEGTLIRVTRDHSYVEELVDAGEITADEARTHPNRSVITRALGSDPNMYADHFALGVERGDRLILCSDGMSGMLPDDEIEHIAVQSATAQICTDNLVDAALVAGGSDNVTVVVVDIVDDGEFERTRKRHRRNILAGVAAGLALIVLIAGIAVSSIATSYYVGVNEETGDTVAIYRGITESFFGLELHWLEDETSIKLEDLPDDTQNRLAEGISQESLEAAYETISNYRAQIDEAKEQQAENAATIAESVEAEESAEESEDAEETGDSADDSDTAASSDADDADADDAESALEENPADTVAPTDSSSDEGSEQ